MRKEEKVERCLKEMDKCQYIAAVANKQQKRLRINVKVVC